jgi:predicted TIM-barrel fold metal-dependent hydrolase
VIDTCIHHRWASQAEVMEYVPAGWRSWAELRGRLDMSGGGISWRQIAPMVRYANPAGEDLSVGAASSYETLAEHLFGQAGTSRALLVHERGMLSPALSNPMFAAVVVRALNQWTIERWLERDARLHGAVLVASQQPEEAVAEIRRFAPHPQIAAVLLAANAIGKSFGHPLYHPIYRAAVEHDLPVIIHRGGDSLLDQPSMPTAGGLPLTFAEYAVLSASPLASHVTNLISAGVFATYPELRIHIIGGVAWVPGLLYRMEVGWRGLRREIPWVKDSPEEYFRRHFTISTYGLERASRPGTIERLVRAFPWFAEITCFGSGYPSWDTTSVEDIARVFPAPWHEDILEGNALRWFRWGTAKIPKGTGSSAVAGEGARV